MGLGRKAANRMTNTMSAPVIAKEGVIHEYNRSQWRSHYELRLRRRDAASAPPYLPYCKTGTVGCVHYGHRPVSRRPHSLATCWTHLPERGPPRLVHQRSMFHRRWSLRTITTSHREPMPLPLHRAGQNRDRRLRDAEERRRRRCDRVVRGV